MNGNLLQIFNCYTQCSEAQSAQTACTRTHTRTERETQASTPSTKWSVHGVCTHTHIHRYDTHTQVNRQSACRAEPTMMMMMMLCMRMMMIMLPADAPNKCAMCVAVVVGPLIMKFDNDVALRLPDRLLAAAANIADTRPVFRNYFK